MAGYSNQTPNDVYKNGTLSRMTAAERQFVMENSKDPYANSRPSLMNLYGDPKKSIPTYAKGSSDTPFSSGIKAIVVNNKIVGTSWPDREGQKTTTSDTQKAINDAKAGKITAKEAIFIIRSRIDMVETKIPAIPSGGLSSNEALARADITTDKSVYNPTGDTTKDTNFDKNLAKQIKNVDNAAKLVNAFNEYTDEIKNGLENGTIKETVDIYGNSRLIKKDPSQPLGWGLSYPTKVNDLISELKKKGEFDGAIDEFSHMASGNSSRTNEKTGRDTGPQLKIFQLASGIKTTTTGDVVYKNIKAGVQDFAYPSILTAILVTGLLHASNKLTAGQASNILAAIEKVSVAAKTLKNASRATSTKGSWLDQISPIYSIAAPYGWYMVGHALEGFIKRQVVKAGVTAEVAIYTGPVITLIVIATELAWEYWKYKKKEKEEKERLEKEARDRKLLPGPYIESGGDIQIPYVETDENIPNPYFNENNQQDNTRQQTPPATAVQIKLPIGVEITPSGDPEVLTYGDIYGPNYPLAKVPFPVVVDGKVVPGATYPKLKWVQMVNGKNGVAEIESKETPAKKRKKKSRGNKSSQTDTGTGTGTGTGTEKGNGGAKSGEDTSLNGTTQVGIHNNLVSFTDNDEDTTTLNISQLNRLQDTFDRNEKYKEVVNKNDSNGFGIMSDADGRPYRPSETAPERGGISGDEPDFRSPLERLTDSDPFGDGTDNETVDSSELDYYPEDVDPISDKTGQPSISPQSILGNSNDVITGY